MNFDKEIDYILKYGIGEGTDRANLSLMRDINHIRKKIHLLKMIAFSEFVANVIKKSNLKEGDISELVFGDTDTYGADSKDNSNLLFDIKTNDSSKINHSTILSIKIAVNNEIEGLGRITPNNFGEQKQMDETGEIIVKCKYSTLEEDIKSALINHEVLKEYQKSYLDVTLGVKEESTKVKGSKI